MNDYMMLKAETMLGQDGSIWVLWADDPQRPWWFHSLRIDDPPPPPQPEYGGGAVFRVVLTCLVFWLVIAWAIAWTLL